MTRDSSLRIQELMATHKSRDTVLWVASAVLFGVAALFWWRAESRQAAPLVEEPTLELSEEDAPPLSGSDATADGPRDQILAKLDPRTDGWTTEAFQEQAKLQLQRLGRELPAILKGNIETLTSLIDLKFHCQTLRGVLQPVYSETGVEVFLQNSSVHPGRQFQGIDGCARALRDLLEPFRDVPEIAAHFKIISVKRLENAWQTRVVVELAGESAHGGIQQQSTWQCHWTEGRHEPPKLTSIEATHFLEARRNSARPLFHDATEDLLSELPAYTEQFALGMDHWRATLPLKISVSVQGEQGVSVADVNGDGRDDLFLCETGGLPNRLFLQTSGGKLLDHTESSGIGFEEPCRSALFLDLDNDGDQDLLLGEYWRLRVLENVGEARFEDRFFFESESSLHSLAAADFDGDGLLDVYLCGRIPRQTADEGGILGLPVPYADARNGGPSYLLKNVGGFTFQDVTESAGLGLDNRRFTYAASWEDFDNDGDQDLYVANDFGRNQLFRNEAGTFLDVAEQAGVEDIATGMSVAWGDIDNDGWLDLYVGNMFTAAGNRIIPQPAFREQLDPATWTKLSHHVRGNSLYRNMGDGRFSDITESAAVARGRWTWSTVFGDFNNDGRQDLYVANGFITSERSGAKKTKDDL